LLAAITLGLAPAAAVRADSLSGAALVNALRHGGYVIVMRHPSSPSALPDKAEADPANTKLERQLDETGRKTSREMGQAFRDLHISVGAILSSPAYRARESIRLAGLGEPKTFAELEDGGQSMQSNADAERSTWLREKVSESPGSGTNTLIVTHTPNLTGAFGEAAKDIAAGEALVFHPNGKTNPNLVARIKIEDWPRLASAR
jgi:phosphohistidine phosphatase SixA